MNSYCWKLSKISVVILHYFKVKIINCDIVKKLILPMIKSVILFEIKKSFQLDLSNIESVNNDRKNIKLQTLNLIKFKL